MCRPKIKMVSHLNNTAVGNDKQWSVVMNFFGVVLNLRFDEAEIRMGLNTQVELSNLKS